MHVLIGIIVLCMFLVAIFSIIHAILCMALDLDISPFEIKFFIFGCSLGIMGVILLEMWFE